MAGTQKNAGIARETCGEDEHVESLVETNRHIKQLLQLMTEKGVQAQELAVATPCSFYGFFSKPEALNPGAFLRECESRRMTRHSWKMSDMMAFLT